MKKDMSYVLKRYFIKSVAFFYVQSVTPSNIQNSIKGHLPVAHITVSFFFFLCLSTYSFSQHTHEEVLD